MKAAIVELEMALHTMENNEPINRAEGNIEQADLEASNAASYRQALEILRAADADETSPENTPDPFTEWHRSYLNTPDADLRGHANPVVEAAFNAGRASAAVA